MKEKEDPNYIYSATMVDEERAAIGFPQIMVYLQNKNVIFETNKALFAKHKDLKHIKIWINLFSAYEAYFKYYLSNAYTLRQRWFNNFPDMDHYFIHIFEEYRAWLSFMQTLNLPEDTPVQPLKKYFIEFFSKYNHVYFLHVQKQKHMRSNNYNLNVFIHYWFDCQPIATALKIPKFSLFLPKMDTLWLLLGEK